MADVIVPDVNQTTTATEPAAAPPAATPPAQHDPALNIRETPAFRAVTKQVEEERKAREALQAQLNEILDKEKKAQEAAERKALEEKGEYQTLLAKKEAELKAITDAHARAMVESKLNVRLLSEGAKNETFILGAIAGFRGDADKIDEYVAELKAKEGNALFFGITPDQPAQGLPAAQSGTPATSAKVDVRQIKQDLKDPKKAAAASKALTDYYAVHGEMPKGF